jgi:hypothetical protein
MLKSYIKDIGKKKISYSIVKAIEGGRLRVSPKANKGRKYNSNTTKDRGNRTKKTNSIE